LQAAAVYRDGLELGKQAGLSAESLGQVEFRLGWSMIRSKVDVEAGIKHLDSANRQQPENVEIMVKLAGVLFQENGKQQDLLKCKQLLTKAVSLEASNAEALLLQGKVLHKLGEWRPSIEALEDAVRIQAEDPNQGPPKPNAFYYIGMCNEKMKDFKKSMQNFKKCLTLDSNHFGACIHLANLLANLGEG